MRFLISLSVCLLLLYDGITIGVAVETTTGPTPEVDPCSNYSVLDDLWRSTINPVSSKKMCDVSVNWEGWYRLFIQGESVQMPDTCVPGFRCGTLAPLWLNGGHPTVEDGVVTRDVCGHWNGDCCHFHSNPIRVKACPDNYYVYEIVSPITCHLAYCAVGTITIATPVETTIGPIPEVDPCSNYNVLDDPWRSTSNPVSSKIMCDVSVNWAGWYRLFIQGESVQMPDTCVPEYRCGTRAPLWLNGGHPTVEDGVVTRDVCGHWSGDCCQLHSNPIRVKACPDNYYVYEFVSPIACPLAYCAEVDPCSSYNVLDDLWRSTSNPVSFEPMCDVYVNWAGWYRLFIQGESVQMPDTCVPEYRCGTRAPLWLNGGHPTVEDGVVTRDVCGHWNGDCCYFHSIPIRVKACPDNYYVYEFVSPITCHLAYCAVETITEATPVETTTGPTSVKTTTGPTSAERDPCSELYCIEDEWCGEINGVYGCFCNDNQTRSDPDSFDFFETCESSTGSISISRCQLFEAGFSADDLHLNDPRCRGIIQNGRVEFSFDNNGHTCGTNRMANGTHIIYENFILGAPGSSEGLISRERNLQISFSCVYPQTQTLSMIEINPLESRVNKNLVGQGMYQVRMIPYQDVGFSQPFNGSVNTELNQEIFVEVRVDGVDSRQLVTVIDTCWATPVNDPDYSQRWDLITGECPNPHDNTAKLLQNGVSTSSRFSFRMFIFNSNSTKVYLHCAAHLCIRANNYCSAHCGSGYHQRVGRSLDFYDSSSISMGPFVWSDGNADA